MALLGTYQIVAADAPIAVAVHALSYCRTGSFAVQAGCICWSRNLLHPLHCCRKVCHDFIVTRYHYHAVGSKSQRCHPVGISVHIVQLPVFGDGIGAQQVNVRQKCLFEHPLGLLRSQSGRRAVQKMIVPTAQQLQNATLVQCHRAAARHRLSRLQKLLDQLQCLLAVFCIERLHFILFQRLHRLFDSFF